MSHVHNHCPYCSRPVTRSALSYQENPYCGACLHERLAAVAETIGPTEIVLDGHYLKHVPVDPTPPTPHKPQEMT